MPATSSPDAHPADPLAGLHDALLAWLPSQRWFPAKGREVAGLRTVGHAVVSAPGETPTVEHAVIAVSFSDASGGSAEERYQLVLGVQSGPPADVEYAVIGRRRNEEGGEDVVYDGLADGRISRLFLSLITENATRGPLRFVAEPGTEAPIVGSGRPLIGDVRYGGALTVAGRAAPRLMLHAARLSFPHPDGGVTTVEAPAPADFADLRRAMELA